MTFNRVDAMRAFALIMVSLTSTCNFVESHGVLFGINLGTNSQALLPTGEYASTAHNRPTSSGSFKPIIDDSCNVSERRGKITTTKTTIAPVYNGKQTLKSYQDCKRNPVRNNIGSWSYGKSNIEYPSCGCPRCSAKAESTRLGAYGGFQGSAASGYYNLDLGSGKGSSTAINPQGLSIRIDGGALDPHSGYNQLRSSGSSLRELEENVSSFREQKTPCVTQLPMKLIREERLSFEPRTILTSGRVNQTPRMPKKTFVIHEQPNVNVRTLPSTCDSSSEEDATFEEDNQEVHYPGCGRFLAYKDTGRDYIGQSGNKFVIRGSSSPCTCSKARTNQGNAKISSQKDVIAYNAPSFPEYHPGGVYVSYDNGVRRYDGLSLEDCIRYSQAGGDKEFYNAQRSYEKDDSIVRKKIICEFMLKKI